jgi:hypothetical protein
MGATELAAFITNRDPRFRCVADVDGHQIRVVEWNVDYGWDTVSAAVVLTLAELYDWIRNNQTATVRLGYHNELVPVAKCPILIRGDQFFPYSKDLRAVGPLHWAQREWSSDQPDAEPFLFDQTWTDQAIVDKCLELAGVPQRSLDGAGIYLAAEADIELADGATPWSVIEGVDLVTGYKTFESPPDGTVRRLYITPGIPSSTNVIVYEEGVNCLSARVTRTIEQVYNRIRVTGHPDAFVDVIRRADTPWVPRDITMRLQHDYIQTEAVGQAVAARAITEYCREAAEVEVVTWLDPRRRPGETIGVKGLHLGASEVANLWCQHVNHHGTASEARTTLRLVGGIGETGYLEPQPPVADLEWKIVRETIEIGGVATDVYTILCDGSASWDPDTAPDLLTFAWSNNKNATTGTAHTYTTFFTQAEMDDATAPTITLTVTDEGSRTGTRTVTITVDDPLHEVNTRELYVAAKGKAYATKDGGKTWNGWAPGVDVLSTPEIAGENSSIFGLADGKVHKTDDHLATPPALVKALPAAVNALWLNEFSADRATAGLANGQVQHTANLSAGASAQWALLATLPAAVQHVIETYTGQFWVAMGSQVLVSDDRLASSSALITFTGAGATARHIALSFDSHYACATADDPVKRNDGVQVTFPVLVQDVRTITHHPREARLLAFVQSGSDCLVYEKTPDSDPPEFVQVGTIVGAGQPNRALRDGDNLGEVYLACDNGLYKSMDFGRTWFRMFATNGTTEKCLQIGYGSAPWQAMAPLTIISDTTANDPGIKAKSLWNGSSNDTPPDGWRDIAYDDSGWSAAVVANLGAGQTTAPGANPVWPTADYLAPTEACVFRHEFTLSSGVVTQATLTRKIDGYVDGVWVNNVFVGSKLDDPSPSLISIAIPPTILKPGETNVLALQVTGAIASRSWASWKLEVS